MTELNRDSINWKAVAIVGGSVVALSAGYYLYSRYSSISPKKEFSSIENDITGSSLTSQANHYKELGNKNFRANRFDKALECYSKAIELCPSELEKELAIFYQNRSAAYYNLEKYEESLQDCNSALKINPRYVKVFSRRGKINEILGRFQDALDDSTAVCLLNAFSCDENVKRADRAMKELADILFESMKPDINSKPILPNNYFIREYFKGFENDPLQNDGLVHTNGFHQDEIDPSNLKLIDAIRALKNENFQECLNLSLQVIKEIEMKDPVSEMTLEMCRFHCLAYLLRGTLYYISFDSVRSLKDFEKVIDLSSNFLSESTIKIIVMNTYIRIISCYQETSPVPYEKCLKLFDQVQMMDEENVDLFSFRGQFLIQNLSLEDNSDTFDKIVKDFTKASELSPKNVILKSLRHYSKVFIALKKSDVSSVQSELRKWDILIERNPDHIDSILMQASVFQEIGDLTRAIERFKQAVNISNSSQSNCLIQLAMALLHNSSSNPANYSFSTPKIVDPEALDLIRKAVKIEPRSFTAHETLGTVLNQIGDLKGALLHYDEACKLPNWPKSIKSYLALRESVAAQLRIMENMNISQEEMSQLRENVLLKMYNESASSSYSYQEMNNMRAMVSGDH